VVERFESRRPAGGAAAGFLSAARYAVEVYGDGWLDWNAAASYARIEAATMFASRLPKPEGATDSSLRSG